MSAVALTGKTEETIKMATEKADKKLTLAAKLARIGKEIGKVEKTGQNNGYGGGYKFIEYGVVAGRIREKFDEYGIIIIPAVEHYEKDIVQSGRGASGYHYLLTMNFTIINGDDMEDRLVFPWLGESADYGDKGVNKATTAACKYFLMRLFNISEKSDEDADAQSPEISTVQQPAESAKRKVPPVRALREKIYMMQSAEELDDAHKKLYEAYPEMLTIEKRQLEDAFKKRRDELANADVLPTDDEVNN